MAGGKINSTIGSDAEQVLSILPEASDQVGDKPACVRCKHLLPYGVLIDLDGVHWKADDRSLGVC